MKNLVVYHDPCMDGFCSAWIASMFLKNEIGYYPVNYGESKKIDELLTKIDQETDVYILDFSFKPNILNQIMNSCNRLVLLDHHETAEVDLKDFIQETEKAVIRFDMSKSGCKLTWEYFWPSGKPNWIIEYVEDRDLWKWSLKNSKEINAALGSYEKKFSLWDSILGQKSVEDLANEGSAILRYQRSLTERNLKNSFRITIFGNEILVVNSSILQSEIGEELAKKSSSKIGACYYIPNTESIRWSLRSTSDGPNVAELAKRFGGGGHEHVAGFEIKITENMIPGA